MERHLESCIIVLPIHIQRVSDSCLVVDHHLRAGYVVGTAHFPMYYPIGIPSSDGL